MAEYMIGHKVSLSFYPSLSMLSKAKSTVIVSVQYEFGQQAILVVSS